MSTRTYSKGPCGHRVIYDPVCTDMYEWWCPKCNKGFKLTPREKKMVLAAYTCGKHRGADELRSTIKNTLGIRPSAMQFQTLVTNQFVVCIFKEKKNG